MFKRVVSLLIGSSVVSAVSVPGTTNRLSEAARTDDQFVKCPMILFANQRTELRIESDVTIS